MCQYLFIEKGVRGATSGIRNARPLSCHLTANSSQNVYTLATQLYSSKFPTSKIKPIMLFTTAILSAIFLLLGVAWCGVEQDPQSASILTEPIADVLDRFQH